MKSSMLTTTDTGSTVGSTTGTPNRKLFSLIYPIAYSDPAQISPWEMGSKFSHSIILLFPIFAIIVFNKTYVSDSLPYLLNIDNCYRVII